MSAQKPDPSKFTRMRHYEAGSDSLLTAFLDALEQSGNDNIFKRFLVSADLPELPADFSQFPFPFHIGVFDYSTLNFRVVKIYDAPIIPIGRNLGNFAKINPLLKTICSYMYQVWAFLNFR